MASKYIGLSDEELDIELALFKKELSAIPTGDDPGNMKWFEYVVAEIEELEGLKKRRALIDEILDELTPNPWRI